MTHIYHLYCGGIKGACVDCQYFYSSNNASSEYPQAGVPLTVKTDSQNYVAIKCKREVLHLVHLVVDFIVGIHCLLSLNSTEVKC